jgi:L-ascorbate metabolism protein UlaG (beta-lactamase superfamily)
MLKYKAFQQNPVKVVNRGIMAILPVFGKNPSGDRLTRVQQSAHYSNSAFQNQTLTEVTLKGVSFFKMLKEYRNRPKDTAPPRPLPSVRTDLRTLPSDHPVIVWFGHSSYLVKVGGFHILVDPVFSGNASPVSFFAGAFPGADAYGVKDMPPIDLLLLTHDHYDHLDYKTVVQLAPAVRHICTSLGVGSHLEYWGIPADKITELDWGEGCTIDLKTSRVTDGPSLVTGPPAPGHLTLTATPARHFSGRGLKRGQTLWSSFVLKTGAADGGGDRGTVGAAGGGNDSTPGAADGMRAYSLFLGGDSGYDTHFRDIGRAYGPFDIAILECGQYGVNWPYIHMMPEQTLAAAMDLGAKYLLPVHWGKFTLSLHPWNEPIRRLMAAAATAAAGGNALPLTTPRIGEPVILDESYPQEKWWDM